MYCTGVPFGASMTCQKLKALACENGWRLSALTSISITCESNSFFSQLPGPTIFHQFPWLILRFCLHSAQQWVNQQNQRIIHEWYWMINPSWNPSPDVLSDERPRPRDSEIPFRICQEASDIPMIVIESEDKAEFLFPFNWNRRAASWELVSPTETIGLSGWWTLYTFIYLFIHLFIYIYIYVHVCIDPYNLHAYHNLVVLVLALAATTSQNLFSFELPRRWTPEKPIFISVGKLCLTPFSHDFCHNVCIWLVWGAPPPNNLGILYNSHFFLPPLNIFLVNRLKKRFQLTFHLLSIDFNLLSIDLNLVLIHFNLLLIYFQLISIYFQLISIYFQLISI